MQKEAYEDHPLPIGHGQTVSQPYIVAAMLEALELQPLLAVRTGEALRAGTLARGLELDEVAQEPVDCDADVRPRAETLDLGFRACLDVADEEGSAALDELDDGRLELVFRLGANRCAEVDLDHRRE